MKFLNGIALETCDQNRENLDKNSIAKYHKQIILANWNFHNPKESLIKWAYEKIKEALFSKIVSQRRGRREKNFLHKKVEFLNEIALETCDQNRENSDRNSIAKDHNNDPCLSKL